MAAKALKWQVNEAVMASLTLPPHSRLIMLVLSDRADARTGIIPDDRNPSIRELADMTGLSEATIKRRKPELEAAGWLGYTRPTRVQMSKHETGQYRIAVGRGSGRSASTPEPPDPGAQGEPPEYDSEDEYGPDAGAHSEPPPGAPAEPPNDDSGAQPELPLDTPDDTPGAQGEPPRGLRVSYPGAQGEPPYLKEADLTDHRPSFTSPTADAAVDTTPAAKPKRQRKPKPPPPDRPDVDRVCEHLADRIRANGSKRPNITDTWRTEARLMLDKDGPDETGIPEADVHAAIDWCQDSTFWRGNVLSLPKLRAKYEQLRLAAIAERDRTRRGPNGTARPDWNAAMDRARARDAAKDTTTRQPPWKAIAS